MPYFIMFCCTEQVPGSGWAMQAGVADVVAGAGGCCDGEGGQWPWQLDRDHSAGGSIYSRR
jgi:hypothetical protein